MLNKELAYLVYYIVGLLTFSELQRVLSPKSLKIVKNPNTPSTLDQIDAQLGELRLYRLPKCLLTSINLYSLWLLIVAVRKHCWWILLKHQKRVVGF